MLGPPGSAPFRRRIAIIAARRAMTPNQWQQARFGVAGYFASAAGIMYFCAMSSG
jgi:hypothetical protein